MEGKFKSVFPFAPYDIQLGLMSKLYNAADEGKIGIFESPTGTGKSLSIIASSFCWLKDEKEKNSRKKLMEEEDDDGFGEENDFEMPDWVDEVYSEQKKKEKVTKKRKMEEEGKKKDYKRKKVTKNVISKILRFEEDREPGDEFLLENYDKGGGGSENISSILNELYQDDEELFGAKKEEFKTPKVIYCTRTHSQINQFIKEIRKTKLAFTDLKIISIISRKFFCLNRKVKKLKSLKHINDKCIDIKASECLYFKHKNFNLYSTTITSKLRDIEEYINLGEKLQICPYYGVRKTVAESDVILMPYSTLLHEDTRNSIGISTLKDCVVIIDEAHNLIDAILSINCSEISLKKIRFALGQLLRYFNRYKKRLKRNNLANLLTLISIMKNFESFLRNQKQNLVCDLNFFLESVKLSSINFFTIRNFIELSQLPKKLNGFIEKSMKEEELEEQKNVFYSVKNFLYSLTNLSRDCKILTEISGEGKDEKKIIKFLLLNPSIYFSKIVEDSRAVILTGGTMEPISNLIFQLFPNRKRKMGQNFFEKEKYVGEKKIDIFQFKHVIPEDHLFVSIIPEFDNAKFNFNFENRKNVNTLQSLGKFLVSCARIVPDGIVCFFSSYSYESQVYDYFLKNGFIREIEKEKKFLREPKDSKYVKNVLGEYKKHIDKNYKGSNQYGGFYFKGSFLSCVVGGKMSEGINFSDGYGRMVVIVGMPYPNVNDIVLKEKIRFQKEKFGENQSKNYYVDLCMTKVNQSIGRAIRHNMDYSSIVFVDERYGRKNIVQKLPKWISSKIEGSYKAFFQNLSKFFERKGKFQEDFERKRKRL